MDVKNPTAPCICCYTIPCETLMSTKHAINDKLQGSVTTRLKCGGVVSNQIKKGLLRYDTRCYFNVRSKADINLLNLPHGDDN